MSPGTRPRRPVPKAAFASMVALEAYTRTSVPTSLSHLVRLRASHLNGCRYCLAMHRRDARLDGWSPDRVAAAEQGKITEGADVAVQRAVLALTEAVTRLDGEKSVPDELWFGAEEMLGEGRTRAVLMEIVTINAWNRIAIATRQDPTSLRRITPADLAP